MITYVHIHLSLSLSSFCPDVSEYLEAGDFESLFKYENFNKLFPLDSSKPSPTTPQDNIIERQESAQTHL